MQTIHHSTLHVFHCGNLLPLLTGLWSWQRWIASCWHIALYMVITYLNRHRHTNCQLCDTSVDSILTQKSSVICLATYIIKFHFQTNLIKSHGQLNAEIRAESVHALHSLLAFLRPHTVYAAASGPSNLCMDPSKRPRFLGALHYGQISSLCSLTSEESGYLR